MHCDETRRGYRQSGYRGCKTSTKSGRTCQKWTSQSPHRHSNMPQKKPKVWGIIINVEIQIMNQVEYGVIQQIQKKDGNFVSYIKLILKIYII